MCCLLQEDSIVSIDLANIDRNRLIFWSVLGRKTYGIGTAEHTAFCAANIQFMIGMYWCEASPDTLITRMRAFRGGNDSSLLIRLISEVEGQHAEEDIREKRQLTAQSLRKAARESHGFCLNN